jgi:AcrR family transcriptional regulator
MAQKSDEIEDLRVRRTRKLLQEALIALTVEKGFNAVTVRDITERAMVNRSTFYRHYLDKYDILDKYMDEVGELTAIEEAPADQRSEAHEGRPTGLIKLLNHVQRFGAFYRVMLGQNGDAAFTERFRKNAEKRFRYLFSVRGSEIDPHGPPIEMRLNYISCAAVGAILWWLESEQPCTVDQLAVWLSQLNTTSAGLAWRPPGGVAE